MSESENESRETVADIVADIRERAENAMRNGERLVHNEAVAMLLRSIADRIEAAARRAYAEIDSAVCGIECADSIDIDAVRAALDNTIGESYE